MRLSVGLSSDPARFFFRLMGRTLRPELPAVKRSGALF